MAATRCRDLIGLALAANAVCGSLLVGCREEKAFVPTPVDEDLKAAVDQALQLAITRDVARRDAILAAPATLAPRPDLGPCPIRLTPPASLDVFASPGYGSMGSASQWMTVPAAAVTTTPGYFRSRLESELAFDQRDRLTKARAFVEPSYWTWELDVVIDAQTSPKQLSWGTDGSIASFESGKVSGRAYLYSYQFLAVVCLAPFTAASSEQVQRRTGNTDDALEDDLKNEMIRAAIAALVRAGPLTPQAADAGARAARDGGR